jgi:hypothetical protein
MIKSRRMKWACSTNWGDTDLMKDIGEKAKERGRPLGEPRCMWVDNIKNGS